MNKNNISKDLGFTTDKILEDKGNDDRFGTSMMSFQKRLDFYEQKYKQMKEYKNHHRQEIHQIKLIKNSTQNVMDFKKDEINKKMKNDIFRLQEESRRHEETQNNENNKVNTNIDSILDDQAQCEMFLYDILMRVMYLEQNLGPDLRNEKIRK